MYILLQCFKQSISHCNRHYMVVTLDKFGMESSFTTASCQRGEPLSLQAHTHWYSCFSLHCWSVSLSCSSCTSRFSCNWCPVEFQCRSSGADCSQSPVVSVCAALLSDVKFGASASNNHPLIPHFFSPPPHPAPNSCLPWLVMAGTTFMKDWDHRMSPLYWGERTCSCQWVNTAAAIMRL